MSEKEFERYLKLLGGLLGMSRRQREMIAAELRDHFDERLDDLIATGLSRDEAISRALEEFGDAAGMAHRFVEVATDRRKKRVIRATAYSIGGMALAVLLLFAMWPENARVPITRTSIAQVEAAKPQAETAATEPEISDADRRALKELDSLTELEFYDTPLGEAASFLAKLHSIEIVLLPRSLEESGISADSPLNISLKGVRLRNGLEFISRALGVGWYVDDGAIMIASLQDVQSRMQSRVYAIDDLAKDDESAPAGNAGPFGLAANGLGLANPDSPWESFANLVRRHTGQGGAMWTVNGGEGNLVPAVNGVMVVSQNAQTQDEIQQVLGALRGTRNLGDKPAPADLQPIAARGKSKMEREIQKKLADKVAPIELLETPLHEVCSYLEVREEIQIELDHRALENAGINKDQSITCTTRNEQTLRSVLNRILRPLALTAVVQNDVLLITTVDEASRLLSTRVYPLHDLLSDDSQKSQQELANFVTLITTTLRPPLVNWAEEGGTAAVDAVAQLKSVVVSAPSEAHEQLEKMLDSIRRSRKGNAAALNQKAETAGAVPNAISSRIYYIATGENDKLAISAKELTQAIQDLLSVEIGAEANTVHITPVSSRLIIRAPQSIHRRLEKMTRNELSGMMQTQNAINAFLAP